MPGCEDHVRDRVAGCPLPISRLEKPADQAGVAEVVRQAHDARTPVYPLGGGTELTLGAWPTQPGIGLSTAGVNRLVDYPARDLTITVGAGMTVAELNRLLAAEGQRLPVDAPWPELATLGGVVATGQAGPRRFACGTIRDYLIGFTAVDGRGMPYSGGGRVVKNAAGYNLGRLMTGSLGAFGILTQVTLTVRPVPQGSAMVACPLDNLDAAERLLADLVQIPVLPAAVELLAGPAWDRLPGVPAPVRAGGLRLVVAFEGLRVDIQRMVALLTDRWRAADSSPAVVPEECCPLLWQALVQPPSLPPPSNDTVPLAVRAAVLPAQVTKAVQCVFAVDPQASVQVHAGDGLVRAWLAVQPSARGAGVCQQLRRAISSLDGKLIVLSHPPALQFACETIWGPPGPASHVRQSLRSQFDPQAILNRGRGPGSPNTA